MLTWIRARDEKKQDKGGGYCAAEESGVKF